MSPVSPAWRRTTPLGAALTAVLLAGLPACNGYIEGVSPPAGAAGDPLPGPGGDPDGGVASPLTDPLGPSPAPDARIDAGPPVDLPPPLPPPPTVAATLNTNGGANALAFAPLPGPLDALTLLVQSPAHGQLDVIRRSTSGTSGWELVGNFFAGGTPGGLVVGKAMGRTVIATRLVEGAVVVLPSDAAQPGRLRFPVRAYPYWNRDRDPEGTDSLEPIDALAIGDLDGDGNDELLVASSRGLLVVRGVEQLLDADPEHDTPQLPADVFAPEVRAQSLLLADLDGDGRPELLVLTQGGTALQVYGQSSPDQGAPLAALGEPMPLPTEAVNLVATGCAASPVAAVLVDGRVLGLHPLSGAQAPLPLGPAVALLRAASGLWAAMAPGGTELDLYQGCDLAPNTPSPARMPLGDVALGVEPTGERRLATLAADGAQLSFWNER